MTANAPTRMSQLRDASLGMLAGLSPHEQRAQSHPELSPMLWHVGHVFFMETYWLAERVFGDTALTDAWRELYFPEICAKDERSARLPDAGALAQWAAEVRAYNDDYWRAARRQNHPLLADGYLACFLRQHYAQHLETMRLARAQLALAARTDSRATDITAAPPATPMREVDATTVDIGTPGIDGYDNEKPPFASHVPAFRVARHCVTNAQWLGFMQAGGYERPEWWDPRGWEWQRASATWHPQHWQPLTDGRWHIPADIGTDIASAPVHGIGWHEARAYARYAGLRLPREIEWEAAQRAGALENVHRVWEWCDDAFYPYPGFSPFPYDGYSKPWFDGHHFVARGASVHTEIEVRRPGFRNFYPPTHRHVFAGLRLASA